jgi:antitoxin component of MazEF toxin-antitoxin module
MAERARSPGNGWDEAVANRTLADAFSALGALFLPSSSSGVSRLRRQPRLAILAVIHSFTHGFLPEAVMIKRISKVGNSQGLILDSAFMDLTGLRVGDEVDVTVAPGGTVILTPIRKALPREEVSATIRKTVKDYRRTLKKLA